VLGATILDATSIAPHVFSGLSSHDPGLGSVLGKIVGNASIFNDLAEILFLRPPRRGARALPG
jgi:hypothetical protein